MTLRLKVFISFYDFLQILLGACHSAAYFQQKRWSLVLRLRRRNVHFYVYVAQNVLLPALWGVLIYTFAWGSV